MTTTTSACPAPGELERLLLGDLLDEEMQVLEPHVSGCSRCLQLIREVSRDDALVKAVRAGGKTGAIPRDEIDEALIAQLCRLPLTFEATIPPGRETPAGSPVALRTEDVAGLLAPPRKSDELGRIGSFGILRVLGSGGMGIVFAARQDAPRRVVALKMIRAGSSIGSNRLERFRAESETLARLRHPNVLHILEVGMHAGRPYFTTDYVEGGNLAQKLVGAPLPAREAATLLRTLALTIHAAHEQGVIHRDLKPSNILLGGDGTPLIADFGLAKDMGGSAGPAEETERTDTGAILGTPDYMAPEQAAGRNRAIGPACDVYALGAILYECLTGRPPFKGVTVLDTLDQARTQEPVPPSRLQPGLPRDLQTICLKCLQKNPVSRYGSARALSEDLGRFLFGEPIVARPVRPWERTWKWARRRPAAAALVIVSALSVVALAAGAVIHNVRMRQAVQRAETNEKEAHRQQEIAQDRYRSASDAMNRMVARLEGRGQTNASTRRQLRRELLEESLVFYRKVLDRTDDPDPAIRLDVAEAYLRTAAIQDELGEPAAARDNLLRSIALVEALPKQVQDRVAAQVCLSDCFTRLAAGHGKDVRESIGWQQKALTIRERLAGMFTNDPWHQNELARAHHMMGVILQNSPQSGQAEKHYERAVTLRTRLVREYPETASYQGVLAGSYENLGLLYTQMGRRKEAGAVYEKAARLLRPLVREQANPRDYQEARDNRMALIALCSNWSQILCATGKAKEAVPLLDEGVDLAEKEVKQEPADDVARRYCLNAHGVRAQIHDELKQYALALRDWDRAIELTSEGDRPYRRAQRALTLIKAGEHERAAAEARALAETPGAADDTLFHAASVYSLASGHARRDTRLDAAGQAAATERYARAAMALLERLRAKGYFQPPENVEDLRKSSDLNPLRERADFQRLLKQVEAKKK